MILKYHHNMQTYNTLNSNTEYMKTPIVNKMLNVLIFMAFE